MPAGQRLLQFVREMRRKSVRGSAEAVEEPHDSLGLSPIPKLRRSAVAEIIGKNLEERGIDHRFYESPLRMYCAYPEHLQDQINSTLKQIQEEAKPSVLSVWICEGATYTAARPLESISECDLEGVDSYIVGISYRNKRYGVELEGGVEFLPLRKRNDELIARRLRADRVDWTDHFTECLSNASSIHSVDSRKHILDRAPIDVVYTWVDSKDSRWRSAKNAWAEKQQSKLASSYNEERFVNRDELRYSLRSVWTYAPFIRNVYIVTDGHRPNWLVSNDDRVRVIPHLQIFPDSSDLPTFNSHAIETCLHRIPGLSENFLYFNDDVFLCQETSIEDYFSKSGLIKSRFSPTHYASTAKPGIGAIPTDWASFNATFLIARDFGLTFDRKLCHVPMPMKRSLLGEIEDRYKEEISRTRAAKFRSESDIALPSMFAHFYGIAVGQAVEWEGADGECVYADSGRYDFESKLEQIGCKPPVFACLNVTGTHTDNDLSLQEALLTNFLEQRFPIASPFESCGKDSNKWQ